MSTQGVRGSGTIVPTFRMAEGYDEPHQPDVARSGRASERTLPYPRPEDVAVVDVHHNPLSIEKVLVNRAV